MLISTYKTLLIYPNVCQKVSEQNKNIAWKDVTDEFTFPYALNNKKVLYNQATKEIEFIVAGTADLTFNTPFKLASYPSKYYPVQELFGDIFGFTSSTSPYYYEARVYRRNDGVCLFINTNTTNAQVRVHLRWVCN